MRKYPFKTGLIIGRFQIFHNGHLFIVKKALEICETVVIFIGSSQESGTVRNPFTYELRKKMIQGAIKNNPRIKILPLPDVGYGDNTRWGIYVLSMFESEFGAYPDIIISGNDKERLQWLTPEIAPKTSELLVARGINDISATKCREMLANGDPILKAYIPSNIYAMRQQLGDILKNIK